ncbi:MAG: XRE family transcriptional regulator [Candidatus Methylomirabilis sp.]
MSPEARAHSEAKADRMIAAMALVDLRSALALTQEALAKRLRVKQAAISKLERRTDMYVSTLQHMIEGLGGKLEIRAIFPAGPVIINQFSKLRPLPPSRSPLMVAAKKTRYLKHGKRASS